VRTLERVGKTASVREYEIGSEAWTRERIERGLDPGEGDRPEDNYLLRFEVDLGGPAAPWIATYAGPSPSNVELPR
jgi:hypothetical protein